MSNEIRLGNRPFDAHAVDIWSLGPILHMLVLEDNHGNVPMRPMIDSNTFRMDISSNMHRNGTMVYPTI